MNPEDVRREGKLIPNSRVILCENGSHMCLWDDQEAYAGPDGKSGPDGKLRAEPSGDQDRHRGAAALRESARDRNRALRARGHGGRRGHNPSRRAGLRGARLRQPRPATVPGPGHVRSRPRAEQAFRLRTRDPLQPRRAARPPGRRDRDFHSPAAGSGTPAPRRAAGAALAAGTRPARTRGAAGGALMFSIRKAGESDAAGILECLRSSFEPYRESYTPGGFADTVLSAETIGRRLAEMSVFV